MVLFLLRLTVALASSTSLVSIIVAAPALRRETDPALIGYYDTSNGVGRAALDRDTLGLLRTGQSRNGKMRHRSFLYDLFNLRQLCCERLCWPHRFDLRAHTLEC